MMNQTQPIAHAINEAPQHTKVSRLHTIQSVPEQEQSKMQQSTIGGNLSSKQI